MTLESIAIGAMIAIFGILLYPIFYLITGSTAIGYIVMLTCVSIDGLISTYYAIQVTIRDIKVGKKVRI